MAFCTAAVIALLIRPVAVDLINCNVIKSVYPIVIID